MKKFILAVSAVVILICGIVSATLFLRNDEERFFQENLEALTSNEIVVQPICAWDRNNWCIYLEPYQEVEGVFVSDRWIKK